MAKYRGWVAQVMEMKEFDTEGEARAWAMAERDKYNTASGGKEYYFEIDDCGSEAEDEV